MKLHYSSVYHLNVREGRLEYLNCKCTKEINSCNRLQMALSCIFPQQF